MLLLVLGVSSGSDDDEDMEDDDEDDADLLQDDRYHLPINHEITLQVSYQPTHLAYLDRPIGFSEPGTGWLVMTYK